MPRVQETTDIREGRREAGMTLAASYSSKLQCDFHSLGILFDWRAWKGMKAMETLDAYERRISFCKGSVAHGLKRNEFATLPELVKKRLVKLIARIAEKSYRRGFQHGTLGLHTVDAYKFRYKKSLDQSPFTDVLPPCSCGHTAIERLFMENPMEDLGFRA